MDDATIDDPATGAAEEGAVTSPRQARLDDLARELGALADGTQGVARVQARPGAVEVARQALDGLAAAVADVTARVGAGAGAGAAAGVDAGAAAGAGAGPAGAPARPAGRSQPVVTLVVTDDETRVVLDLAVDEAASGPAVARDVAARLLGHLVEQQLPDPTVDVRIVGVSS